MTIHTELVTLNKRDLRELVEALEQVANGYWRTAIDPAAWENAQAAIKRIREKLNEPQPNR